MFSLSYEAMLGVLAACLMLAMVQRPLLEGLHAVVAKLKAVTDYIDDGLSRVDQALQRLMEAGQDDVQGLGRAVVAALQHVVDGLASLMAILTQTCERILDTVTSGPSNKVQRILGALLNLVAAVAFIYAESALGVNAIAPILLKAGVPLPNVPAWLADLTVPLVIAFIVNLVILAITIADLLHYTSLAPWPRSGWGLKVWRSIAITNFLLVLGLAACFAMPRVAELSSGLSPTVRQLLGNLGAIAMNLVMIPAGITTLLLWSGVFGLLVLVVVGLGLFLAPLGLIRWLAEWEQKLAPLQAAGVGMVLGWCIGLVRAPLRFLAWVIGAIPHLLEVLTEAVEWIVKVVTWLPTKVGEWLTRFDFIAVKVLRLRTPSAEKVATAALVGAAAPLSSRRSANGRSQTRLQAIPS